MDLREAFEPDGVVSVVGAGGKKTTIYKLGSVLDRAIVTATVRIPLFDDHVTELTVTEDPIEAVRNADRWPLGLAPARDADRERYLGYDTETVDALAETTDVPILIKADGARTRWLKAPDDEEPQIPDASDLVTPIASAKAVGKPLDSEFVHRPERVEALTGRSVGEEIRVNDVVTVLSNEYGGLKEIPEGARVVPLINMVDDAPLERTARDIAEGLSEHPRIEHVVLAQMNRGRVIDVIK